MWRSGWLFCTLYLGCDLTLPKLRELNLFGWRNVSINGNCERMEPRLARVGWRVTALLKKNRESLVDLNTRINRSYLSFQKHALAVCGWSRGRRMSWEVTAWMWVIEGRSLLGRGWWPVLTGTPELSVSHTFQGAGCCSQWMDKNDHLWLLRWGSSCLSSTLFPLGKQAIMFRDPERGAHAARKREL